MDLKKTNAPVNTVTYDRNQIDEPTENIYESIQSFQDVQIKLTQRLRKNSLIS